jgi:copper transport protein
VVLRFSEAVDALTSAIAVTGAGETDATTGPSRGVPGDARSLRRPLGLLQPGRYTVRWTSVSADDGHMESGRYTFAIGVVATALRRTDAGLFAGESPTMLAGRLLALAALALWGGLFVISGAARRGGITAVRLGTLSRVGPGAAWIGALVVLADRFARSPVGVAALTAGRSAQLDVVVLVAATVGVLSARRGLTGMRWRVGAAAAAIAIAGEAASGHAGTGSLPLVRSGVLAVHLLAVGTWVAAIVASLISPRVVRTLKATSPYAIGAAAAVLTTGIVATTFEVKSLSSFTTTSYGRLVLAKLLVFAVVVTAGVWHWRRRRSHSYTTSVSRPLRIEALAAGTAVALGAVLSAAPPPMPAALASASTTASTTVSGLDARNAVSVAGAGGPFVIGLTLAPPRPGRVHARVQILSSTETRRALAVHITGSSPGGRPFAMTLRRDGADTFGGSVRIDRRGLWTVGVSLTTGHGWARVGFTLPVPTPNGNRLLARAVGAEEKLASAQLHESVRADTTGPPVIADYVFRAPDALEFTTNGTEEIDLGNRTYRRDGPDREWTAEQTDAAFAWPSPYFRQFWGSGAAARVVGTEVVNGVASNIVAFVRPDLSAWFRIWIGSDGLVRREEMLAEGHLMVHTYSAFDAAPLIGAPVTTASAGVTPASISR